MRAVRTGTLIGVAVVAAAAAVNVINCASATTITLEVRGDSDVCETITETGIVVTAAKKVTETEAYPLQEFQKGCKDGKIGTLVVTPHSNDSTDRNARVGIRVVSGLNGKNASECDDPNGLVGENCIIAKREVTFVEGANVPVTVTLNGRCVHISCPEPFECDPNWTDPDKKCIDRNALNPNSSSSGGTDRDQYAPQLDSGPGKNDAEAGPLPLTPAELCERGKSEQGRNYLNDRCNVNCAKSKDCDNVEPCPPGQKCRILCAGENACTKTRCSGPECDFDCTGSDAGVNHCTDISCDAGTCGVKCASVTGSCKGVVVAGKTNTISCTKIEGQPTCDDVSCIPGQVQGTSCERTCDGPAPNACGTTSACDAGDCSKFQDGG
ncbi:MAG: hypothetical protein U0270_43545 [Labilithrix sp.]